MVIITEAFKNPIKVDKGLKEKLIQKYNDMITRQYDKGINKAVKNKAVTEYNDKIKKNNKLNDNSSGIILTDKKGNLSQLELDDIYKTKADILKKYIRNEPLTAEEKSRISDVVKTLGI